MKPSNARRVAIVVRGWHFPRRFYESMAAQRVPGGWVVDHYVVPGREGEAHHARSEKFAALARAGEDDLLRTATARAAASLSPTTV